MNAKSIPAVAAVVAVALLTSGCTTAIKEGVGLFRGGQGTFALLSPKYADPSLLAAYTNFRIGSMNDETDLVPPDFF
ncbi:MAG: hypothetical protein KAU28_09480, partial [Phycisphaerae bacterium]|nr:hypothetical protein [Phycisphaerae bacterium]